jgi:EF hand domain-containing protein
MRTIRPALLGMAVLAGAAVPALAQPAPPPGPASPGPGPRGPAALFALVDANGDGRVTPEEASAYVQARFAAADRNGDGALVLEEAQTVRLAPAPDGAPRPESGPMRARVAAAVFRAVDANRDGRVTPEEVRPAVDAHIRALDANGDNGVTLDELPQPRWGRHHGHPHAGRPAAPPRPPG